MRNDLNKQLCESERRGSQNSYADHRHMARVERDYDKVMEEDDEAFGGAQGGIRESMKKRPKLTYMEKEFGEHFAPLYGFIRKNLGKYWDKVYSELSQNFDTRSAINRHIAIHLFEFIKVKTFIKDGRIYCAGRFSAEPIEDSGASFYVHPMSGCICEVRNRNTWGKYKRQWAAEIRAKNSNSATRFIVDESTELHKIDDVWYEIGYKVPSPANAPFSRSIIGVDLLTREKVYSDWSIRYAATRRTLSHKELKQYELI